ncbi:peptide-methionine (S)-S-oxide reductase MsrA [Fulvitalea axinellae]
MIRFVLLTLSFLLLKGSGYAKVGSMETDKGKEVAVFGAGCFWCVEAVFQELKGVESVEAGYTGGGVKNPTYRQICTGLTGHAEVAKVVFDPGQVSFADLLQVFWSTHDPTTLNRQGADKGTQYRSAVFYTSEEQKREAEKFKNELNEKDVFGKPVVTEITALGDYYPAENYHQDYYDNNKDAGYCQVVIKPKLEKLRKVFSDKLKD